jgi:hypothetical protein
MAFCDYCSCSACLSCNDDNLTHAETEDGRFICHTCFTYNRECIKEIGEPCSNKNCHHRPVLISGFYNEVPKE